MVSNPWSVAFRREGRERPRGCPGRFFGAGDPGSSSPMGICVRGVGIIWCRGQYIDPAIQNDAEPLDKPTPKSYAQRVRTRGGGGRGGERDVFREAACSSGQSHYFFHSRETSTSTSTGTFLSSFSPALIMACLVLSETSGPAPRRIPQRTRRG